jgi:hypothetical protein
MTFGECVDGPYAGYFAPVDDGVEFVMVKPRFGNFVAKRYRVIVTPGGDTLLKYSPGQVESDHGAPREDRRDEDDSSPAG